MAIRTIDKFNFNTLEDLKEALRLMKIHTDTLSINDGVIMSNCDTLCLMEMTLSDGSKVYNISLS